MKSTTKAVKAEKKAVAKKVVAEKVQYNISSDAASFRSFEAIMQKLNVTDSTLQFEASDADVNRIATLYDVDELAALRAAQMLIDLAQIKRNLSATTDKTSLFCRLSESTRQNYRIDIAIADFHTMRELMTLTDCSESRIKSHIKYVMTNCADHCKRVIDTNDTKRFKFVLTVI